MKNYIHWLNVSSFFSNTAQKQLVIYIGKSTWIGNASKFLKYVIRSHRELHFIMFKLCVRCIIKCIFSCAKHNSTWRVFIIYYVVDICLNRFTQICKYIFFLYLQNTRIDTSQYLTYYRVAYCISDIPENEHAFTIEEKDKTQPFYHFWLFCTRLFNCPLKHLMPLHLKSGF